MPLKSSNRRQHGAASVAKTASPAPVKVAVKVAGGAGRVASAPANVIGAHSHNGVLLGAVALLIFSTWKGFWQPTIDTIWNGTTWNTPIDGKLILGGIVFAIVLAMLADSSDDAAALIIVLLIGLWLLFIMFNGLTTVEAFFNWFGTGGSSSSSSSTGGSRNATPAEVAALNAVGNAIVGNNKNATPQQIQQALNNVGNAVLGNSNGQPTQQQVNQALKNVGNSII